MKSESFSFDTIFQNCNHIEDRGTLIICKFIKFIIIVFRIVKGRNNIHSCYGCLSVLRKLKNLAPFKVRKQLAETLILSKIDYNDTVSNPIPIFDKTTAASPISGCWVCYGTFC